MYFVPLDNYVTYGLKGHCHLREGELGFILKNYFASIFYSTKYMQDFYLKVVFARSCYFHNQKMHLGYNPTTNLANQSRNVLRCVEQERLNAFVDLFK